MAATITVAETHEGRFSQSISAGTHVLRADEPAAAGGTDLGPDPYALLLGALGACTAMTLRLYADRKQWKLDHVEVLLRHGRVHAADCADCDTKAGMVDLIVREIVLDGELDEDQRRKLLEIAEKCPVHRTLTGEIKIVSGLMGRGSVVSGGEE